MFSSSKCVLFLSDEGVNIYDVSSGKASFVDSVPWHTEDFEEAVAETIKRKCRGKPVILLNDMVEQHYRKERIPKVSSLDKARVVQNHLSAAFQAYPIRAALKLKDKKPGVRDDGLGAASSGTYLFAAVPFSDYIRRTLAAIKRSHSPIRGFSLLPVESSSMVQALSKKLTKGASRTSVWTVFVGQHQSGGLRQIVTRNGELALTRMTPIIDSDTDPETWAGEVAMEIKGTMSYLSRFGYDSSDGLDIIVIASNASADLLSTKIDFDANLNVLTSNEAGTLLGLRVSSTQEPRYADPLHAAWVGAKSALALPLQSASLTQITKPVRVANMASVALLVLCCYFGYMTMMSSSKWSETNDKLAAQEQVLAATQAEHAKELQIKKDAGIDFLLIESATTIFKDLESRSMKPLSTLDLIGRALGSDLHINSLDIVPSKEDNLAVADDQSEAAVVADESAPADDTQADPAVKSRNYDIVIRIVFPGTLNPETGVKQINDLQQRLQNSLRDHTVTIIKQVADLSYTGNFVGEATSANGSPSGEKENYEAQIQITGPLL